MRAVIEIIYLLLFFFFFYFNYTDADHEILNEQGVSLYMCVLICAVIVELKEYIYYCFFFFYFNDTDAACICDHDILDEQRVSL